MRKLLRSGFQLLLGAAFALVLLLTLLLSNSRFNHWLVAQIDAQIPELSIAKIDGLLLGKLQLTDISYQSERVTVSIKSLAYQYRLADLLALRIHFESVQVTGIDVVLHEYAKQDAESAAIEFIMPIALQVQDFSLYSLRIHQNETEYLIDKVGLALIYQGQQLQLSQFSLDSEMVQVHGKAELQLAAQFPFKVDLDLTKPVPEQAELKARVSINGDSQKVYLDAVLQAPNTALAQGWIEFSEALPHFDLQLGWSTLQWSLQGDKQYASENARLKLQGNAEQYLVTFDSALFAKDLSVGQLHLEGQGDRQQLTLSTLILEALEGNMQAKGNISWTESIPNRIQLKVNKFQLASVIPDYPGEVSLEAQLSGQLFNQPDLDLRIEKLQGVILDKKLQASGQVHYSPEQTLIKHFQANVGANQIDIQGQFGVSNELTFKLRANNLHELHHELSGSVFAQGSLQGAIEQAVVKLKLQANGLGFQGQKAANIQAKAAIDTTGKGQLDLQFSAHNIVFNDQQIEKIELQSIGQNAHHEIRAQVLSEQANMQLAMQGAWTPATKQWRGQMQQLQVQSESAGRWRMIKDSPFNMTFSDLQEIKLHTELCLAQSAGTGLFCLEVWPEPTGQKIAGTIKQLPLAVFADWVPTAVKVNSHLNSQFSLSLEESLRGDIQLTLDPGVMIVQDDNLGVQRINFKEVHLDVELQANTMQSNLSVLLNDTNRIKGQVEVNGLERPETANINALLKIQLEQIGFISAFADSVSNVGGKLNAELHLQGLLKAPSLDKSWLKLQHGTLTVVDAGLKINDLNMQLTHLKGEQLSLMGSADIGGHPLMINGHIDNYASDQLLYEIKMNGENLPLLQMPEMQAWLSPDLHLTGDKRSAMLKGSLTIPKAIMVFQTLPEGAVELSSDEVIISNEKIKPKESRYPIDMDVMIKLGDAVSIEGFGLQTRLQGELRALREINNLRLFNELNLLDGTYTAYGQDLTIEKGQFLFAGNMQNPGINILASREASDWDDKTIAYLSMTGTLNNPVTRIYTEPASSDSEALAYLLTGAPMGKGDASSSGLIAKAALSLGRDYVDAVMGTVGIDEFDIKSTNLGQNSMIVGKRISPRLYARYIMDVLTTQMQFAVEYRLTENISIETRAGSTHSSDIKYNIEFD